MFYGVFVYDMLSPLFIILDSSINSLQSNVNRSSMEGGEAITTHFNKYGVILIQLRDIGEWECDRNEERGKGSRGFCGASRLSVFLHDLLAKRLV